MQVEARLRQLEGKALGALSARKTGSNPQKYDKFRSSDSPGMITTPRAYNVEGDIAMETPKSKEKSSKTEKEKKDKSEKKEKKRKSRGEGDTPKEKGPDSEKKKKKKDK